MEFSPNTVILLQGIALERYSDTTPCVMASQIAVNMTCLFNRLFKLTTRKISKCRIIGLCESTGHQWIPFTKGPAIVFISWRHQVLAPTRSPQPFASRRKFNQNCSMAHKICTGFVLVCFAVITVWIARAFLWLYSHIIHDCFIETWAIAIFFLLLVKLSRKLWVK